MDSLQRVEKLLTLLVLHNLEGAPQTRKMELLSRAGFLNSEIATMLGTTAASVAQQLYTLKKRANNRTNKKDKHKKKKR